MEDKKVFGEAMEETTDKALENAAGGNAGAYGYGPDPVHNLNNYMYRTVCNLPAGECLVMQREPRGAFLPVQYWNGEPIFVHRTFMERGYFLAYRDGVYGYVDSAFVR